jgi:hypothetical protein
MGQSAVSGRGLAWLARGRRLALGKRPPPLILGIIAGFAALAALALAAPEPTPDRTVEAFVWTRAETALGWPLPESAEPPSPSPPRVTVERLSLVQTPAVRRKADAAHEWFPNPDMEGGGDPQTFAIGELRITVGSAAEDRVQGGGELEPYGAIIMVEAPGMTPWRMRRDDVRTGVTFGVSRIDAGRPGPQLLVGVFAGGMRCCMSYVLLTPENGRWRETSLDPQVEARGLEGAIAGWPIDYDGDGRLELRLFESSYSYMGEAWPPYVFLQVRGGKVVDVSDDRRFWPQHLARMKQAEVGCRRHDNEACGALVLMAGKLGDEARAWRIMLANYDRGGMHGDDFPDHVRRYRSDGDEAWR